MNEPANSQQSGGLDDRSSSPHVAKGHTYAEELGWRRNRILIRVYCRDELHNHLLIYAG